MTNQITTDKKEIANFFWHGDFGKFETACVKSFIENQFDVYLWSYTGISVEGAKSCDAREILPESEIYQCSQRGQRGNPEDDSSNHGKLAAFSDLFRYKVLNINGGWWFDCDFICLKNQSYFKNLRKENPICSAYEYVGEDKTSKIYTASGGFYLDKKVSKDLLEKALSICKEQDYCINWGDIGPKLYTDYVYEKNLKEFVYPPSYFYPVIPMDARKFADPNEYRNIMKLTKDSYVVHLWDTCLMYAGVDKNNPPPRSFLHRMIKKFN